MAGTWGCFLNVASTKMFITRALSELPRPTSDPAYRPGGRTHQALGPLLLYPGMNVTGVTRREVVELSSSFKPGCVPSNVERPKRSETPQKQSRGRHLCGGV